MNPAEMQAEQCGRLQESPDRDLFEEELAIAIGHTNGNSSEADALFEILWKSVEKFVGRLVRAILRGYPYDVDDVVAQTRYRAREKIYQYRRQPGATFRSWLGRVAKTMALNWIRRERRFVPMSHLPEWTVELLCGEVRSAEEDYIDNEVKLKVRDAIEELPSVQKQVVRLMDYEGMTVEETARELNISQSFVKTSHYRAKRRLEQILKSHNILEGLKK